MFALLHRSFEDPAEKPEVNMIIYTKWFCIILGSNSSQWAVTRPTWQRWGDYFLCCWCVTRDDPLSLFQSWWWWWHITLMEAEVEKKTGGELSEYRCKLIISPEATMCTAPIAHTELWLALTSAVGKMTGVQVMLGTGWKNQEKLFVSRSLSLEATRKDSIMMMD